MNQNESAAPKGRRRNSSSPAGCQISDIAPAARTDLASEAAPTEIDPQKPNRLV